MLLPMLVVDKNIEVSRVEQAEWLKHGIPTVRVDTMQEAIERLTKESFLFTVINADNVNYLPLLKVMRETALTLIFIIATECTVEKTIEAIRNGADVFTEFNADVEQNVQLALAQLLRCAERDVAPKNPHGMMIYENFLVLSDSRRVYYHDERITLTKKEYDLLHYFIANHDISLSYRKIYRRVWGGDITETSRKTLLNTVDKLKRKIAEMNSDHNYFLNEREHGYIFSAKADK